MVDRTEKADIERAKDNIQPASITTLKELQGQKTIDTIHTDEALRVLANYAGDRTWTEIEEKRVIKKVDRQLLPLLILTYGMLRATGAALWPCSRCAVDHGLLTITTRPAIL